MSSQILCCASGGSFNIQIPTKLGRTELQGSKPKKAAENYDGINGEPTEFEWNIFTGFTTLQLCGKINDLLSDLGETPETFTGRILFMSMFNDISCDRKGNKDECLANAGVVKVLARRFGVEQWSFIGPGSEKKWYSGEENSPHKELGIISRTKCCWNSCNDSIVQGYSQKQRTWKTVDTLHCR